MGSSTATSSTTAWQNNPTIFVAQATGVTVLRSGSALVIPPTRCENSLSDTNLYSSDAQAGLGWIMSHMAIRAAAA